MSPRPVVQPPPAAPTDKQLCSYIAAICAELRDLARRHRLGTISFLLDMARLESERTAERLSE